MLEDHHIAAAAGFLCRSLARIVGCLEDLDGAEQRWQPPAPTANSLLAIAAHALANAEDNVLGVLGQQPVPRERAAEFDVRGLTAEAVRQRWAQLEPRLTRALQQMPASALVAEVSHPRRGRLSAFEVLLVALRHAAEHQGEAELTRTLVLAQRAGGPPAPGRPEQRKDA
jgi:hypothetical protein